MNHRPAILRALHPAARLVAAPRAWMAGVWMAAVWMTGVWLAVAGPAQAAEALPNQLVGVTVVENLGGQVDPGLTFTDHTGATVTMGDLLAADVPVLLTLNYYTCETLCSLQLNALLDGLKALDWTPGERFRIVTISIDPKETAALAESKRASYLESYGRGPDVDWQFLVGTEDQINHIATTIGFGFKYDAPSGQYAHPAVLTFLSPAGTVARYVYGVQYAAKDLRFALMEASAGRLGSPVDKLVLSCFRYDETAGRYTPFAFGVMRLGGVMTMVAMAGLGIVLWRRERSRPDRSDS